MPNKQLVDILIHARWIITADADHQVIENGWLALDAGKIAGLGQLAPGTNTDDCPFTGKTHIDCSDQVVMPGLINAHGHLSMSLFRGLADDLPLMDWLNNHIWPAEKRWVNEEFTHDGARLAMAEMIRGGTTCFSDNYFFPQAVVRAARTAGMRAQLAFPILDFPTNWASSADEYLELGLALQSELASDSRIDLCLGPHAPYTVSDAPLQRVRNLADQHQLLIQMHVHETAFEVEEALKQGQRPLTRLHQLGLLGPDFQAVHMTQLTDEDIELVASTGSHVVHCPESNLKLGSGFCRVADLLAAGVNVALGTDGAASNNDLDMFGEMRTAALLAKGYSGNPTAVPAWQAIEMATINGARALGIADKTGSLEVGKAADITTLRLDTLNSAPSFDVVSQVVYTSQSSQVHHVWIDGEPVLQAGELTTLNEADIIANAQAWQAQIKQPD